MANPPQLFVPQVNSIANQDSNLYESLQQIITYNNQLNTRVTALEASVATLQAIVTALQSQVATLSGSK